MANYVIQDTTLTNIADAIRSKQKPETEKIETIIETKVSKTPNATGFDSYSGSYSDNMARTDTVTITGATKIKVKIAYQTESTNYDYVNITPRTGTAVEKLGGTTRQEKEYEFPGTDTVAFYFKSDSSNGNYLGYYAEVTGYTVEEVELPLPEYTPVEMAEAISAIETGGGGSSALADIYYDCETGSSLSNIRQFFEFDVSNANTFSFTYDYDTSSRSDAVTKFTFIAQLGYKVQKSTSNTIAPRIEKVAVDSDPVSKNICSNISADVSASVTLDVSNYSVIALQLESLPYTNGSASYGSVYIHDITLN